jgi:hypothetical protein
MSLPKERYPWLEQIGDLLEPNLKLLASKTGLSQWPGKASPPDLTEQTQGPICLTLDHMSVIGSLHLGETSGSATEKPSSEQKQKEDQRIALHGLKPHLRKLPLLKAGRQKKEQANDRADPLKAFRKEGCLDNEGAKASGVKGHEREWALELENLHDEVLLERVKIVKEGLRERKEKAIKAASSWQAPWSAGAIGAIYGKAPMVRTDFQPPLALISVIPTLDTTPMFPSYKAPVQVRNVTERNSGTAVPDETALRNSVMVKWQRLAERLGADALEDHEFLMEEQWVVQGWSAVFAAKSTVTLVNRFYDLDRPVMCARLHQLPWPPTTGEILQFFRAYSAPTSPRSTSTSKRNRGHGSAR